MKIAFAGSPAAAATVLRHLDSTAHEVAVVVTQPDRRRGRSGRPRPTAVGELAEERGLRLLRPSSINDDEVLDEMRTRAVGALAVVAFGQILREPLLSEWPCLNVHFSLLPAYRGAAPVERAIIDGVDETGVTIMRMDEGLDTGPTIATRHLRLAPTDTGGEVTERLAALGGPALVEALDAVEAGRLVTTPQPEDGVSFAPRIVAEDRALDPAQTAQAVADRVRALAPHIGATLTIDGEPFKIWTAFPRPGLRPARPLETHESGLALRCADGAVLIEELQPPGRGPMAAADFLRGWRGDLALSA